MTKSGMKKLIRKALLESGEFKNVKVWDIETRNDSWDGKKWLNIEISLNSKRKKS